MDKPVLGGLLMSLNLHFRSLRSATPMPAAILEGHFSQYLNTVSEDSGCPQHDDGDLWVP